MTADVLFSPVYTAVDFTQFNRYFANEDSLVEQQFLLEDVLVRTAEQTSQLQMFPQIAFRRRTLIERVCDPVLYIVADYL